MSEVYDLSYFEEHQANLKPGEPVVSGLGAGDCCLYLNVLSDEAQTTAFEVWIAQTDDVKADSPVT